MIYLWSDTHFNHRGILKHTNRPWTTVRQMNEALTEVWNATVRKESDDVYLLGDFGFHAPTDPETEDLGVIFWRLRGKKHLIVGNHDVKNSQVMRLPWESVELIREAKHEGRRAVLCHYPMESWPGMHRGVAHFHGHCHGTLRRKMPKRFDLGVECFPYPVAWEEIHALADKEVFSAVDHHGAGGDGTPGPGEL